MDAYTRGRAPHRHSGRRCTRRAGSRRRSISTAISCSGPEAAHLNITGVSGLATKTSAVEFLLGSIFQTFPSHKGTVAAVCFNVKGPDLCFLDQPAALGAEDLRLYARLGLAAGAVRRACATTRRSRRTASTSTPCAPTRRSPRNTEPLVWGLREVLDYAEVLLNRDDIDAKADAFIDFLAERVVGREYQDEMLRGKPFQVQSFADLEEFFRAIFDFMEVLGKGGEVWKTHHIATIRKIRNRLSNISTRSKGLVTDDGAANDLPWGRFEDRSVHVVDVAGLDPLAQDLVFARIVSKLREHLERRDLGVDHVVVFVDELNKYAPADGPDTYVRKMLLDLSERGRYLGPGALLRPAVPLPGAAPGGRQRRHRRLRPHGHGRARHAGVRHDLARDQDQARHAAQGRADAAPPALHPADLREVPPARGADRPGGRRALSAGGRAALCRRGGAPAAHARPPGLRRCRSGAGRGPPRGRRPPGARRSPGASARPTSYAFFTACLGRRVERRGAAAAPRRCRPSRRADDRLRADLVARLILPRTYETILDA